MKSRVGLALGLVASSACINGTVAFQQQPRWKTSSPGSFFKFSSTTPVFARQLLSQRTPIPGCEGRKNDGIGELRASAADASSAPLNEKRKGRKASVKKAVELWSQDSLELHRFHDKRVHVCDAKTLPEVLSQFWRLVAKCAQAKFSAMADDRDYAAHILFVVHQCDLLKDYGMMRQLDKVLDFCSGGCRDFGRTVTLQHYHPNFSLPPSQGHSDGRHDSKDLARVVNFSRSPYPVFGLTVAGGNAARSDPISASDRISRLRVDLEMVYNSVAGCSTDDSIDAHGSEHGTIPSSPEEVEKKTLGWLKKNSEDSRGRTSREGEIRSDCGRFLDGAKDDVVTSDLSTPEEVLSQIWSIVKQLQVETAPILSAKEVSDSTTTAMVGVRKASSASGIPDGGAGEGGKNQREPLASKLLVAPRLHPFNSAQFESFVSNLAIALKQTPIMDRFEVEVYHPEYVFDEGVVDLIRRSPYPTLFIKHCGLKDELFRPSGLYRHTVPPLKLPSETVAPSEHDADESSLKDSTPENSPSST